MRKHLSYYIPALHWGIPIKKHIDFIEKIIDGDRKQLFYGFTIGQTWIGVIRRGMVKEQADA